MKRCNQIFLFAAAMLFSFQAAHGDSGFKEELAFCKTANTPMPDPRAPSFYTALPMRNGVATATGWSGHVNAWFQYMRDENSGATKQYLAHNAKLSHAAKEYREVVVQKETQLLKEVNKNTFKKSVNELNRRTDSRLKTLLQQYVNESREVASAFAELKGALLDLQRAKTALVSVHSEYESFLTEMGRQELEGEKERLIGDAAKIQELLFLTVNSLSNITAAIPFDAISIMKGISGEPTKLAFGPDSEKLATLDPKLQALDDNIVEHKNRGFRINIEAARLELEKSQMVALNSASRIVDHKRKSWQAVNELADLERKGQGFQFFHKLRDYYKSVAFKAAALNEAVNDYNQFLTTGKPSEGELLWKRIEADIAHIHQNKLEPTGDWMKLATSAALWLDERYIPWYRSEVQRVGACLTGFKELRYLGPVDKFLNLAIEAAGGIPNPNLGKYLL